MSKFLLTCLALCFAMNTITAQTLDSENSLVRFRVDNTSLRTAEGTINGFTGELNFNPMTPDSASFDICVDPATVNTNSFERDRELVKDAYFNIDIYPSVCFVSKSVSPDGDRFKVTGDMTITNVTQEEVIYFSYKDGTFEANKEINRIDYDLGPGSGMLVGKEVYLQIIIKTLVDEK